TSYALAGDEAKALAAGCNAYVTKPFSLYSSSGTRRGTTHLAWAAGRSIVAPDRFKRFWKD
ncbi:MAG: hypothetical protein WAL15_25910, partial [Xanthobacteraceae bacterium]